MATPADTQKPTPIAGDDELLTVAQLAAEWHCHRSTIYEEMAAGRLRSLIIGTRCRRIPRWAVREYIGRKIDVSVA